MGCGGPRHSGEDICKSQLVSCSTCLPTLHHSHYSHNSQQFTADTRSHNTTLLLSQAAHQDQKTREGMTLGDQEVRYIFICGFYWFKIYMTFFIRDHWVAIFNPFGDETPFWENYVLSPQLVHGHLHTIQHIISWSPVGMINENILIRPRGLTSSHMVPSLLTISCTQPLGGYACFSVTCCMSDSSLGF